MLWLQGSERMTCEELLAAVAEQYSVTAEKYCRKMRRSSEWGGGPELGVLANILRCPPPLFHGTLQNLKATDD